MSTRYVVIRALWAVIVFVLTLSLLLYVGSLDHVTGILGRVALIQSAAEGSKNLAALTEINVARVETARRACARHSYDVSTRLQDERTVWRLLVDDEHRLLYCVIPKAGCTSMKGLLIQAASGGPAAPVSDLNATDKAYSRRIHGMPPKYGMRYLARFSARERYERLKTYTKVLVVRHPFSRLYSAYNDKIGHGYLRRPNSYAAVVRRHYPDGVAANGKLSLSFPQFLSVLAREYTSGDFLNRHWLSYEKLCHPCVIPYDVIMKLETLQEDFRLLAPLLNMAPSSLPWLNSYNSNSSRYKATWIDHMKRVSPDDVTRLQEIYKADFDVFGYDSQK